MAMITTHALGDVEERLRRPPAPGVFGDEELVGLPAPVARYFRAAIAPGAPLSRSADLDMRGSLKLGGRWLRMRAHEVLAPHDGFVWRARVAGVISGSDRGIDGLGAMDWKLLGVVPVVHVDGADIGRSAAGRAAGEAVWVPTALLPRFDVRWAAASDHDITARFTVAGEDVTLDLRIDDVGDVQWVRFERWGDPERTGAFAFHPFAFEADETLTFGPYRIPGAGSAGWLYESDSSSDGEFFRCTITALAPTLEVTTSGH